MKGFRLLTRGILRPWLPEAVQDWQKKHFILSAPLLTFRKWTEEWVEERERESFFSKICTFIYMYIYEKSDMLLLVKLITVLWAAFIQCHTDNFTKPGVFQSNFHNVKTYQTKMRKRKKKICIFWNFSKHSASHNFSYTYFYPQLEININQINIFIMKLELYAVSQTKTIVLI